jgi:nitroreductase
MDAIRQRRSIRRYEPDEIPPQVLDKLLTAVRLAPSGGNRQPWKFIVVRDDKTKAGLAEACRWGRFLGQALLVIVACGAEGQAAARYRKDEEIDVVYGEPVPKESEALEYYNACVTDLAIALDHLSLVAVEEGLGTCWIGGLGERIVKELLAVPDDMMIPFVMSVGYPVDWPDARPRKPLEGIICYDSYR